MFEYCSLRRGREHRNLRLFSKPQITGPHVDERGRHYLLYKEDVSKTNHGGPKDRKVPPKENNQPSSSDGKDSNYFYFNPMINYSQNKWFSRLTVGHNSLQMTIKRLCKSAGIPGSKTNHSLRATAATRLFQANVEEQLICEVTGHRSEAVRAYKRSSDDQKENVSRLLTGAKVARKTYNFYFH
ncbi:hypothetical protein LOTGIDRAFT_163071 [Lottia gigantea]|uniref:Tyr recombinase domain-containing protein n=1 Tax=Lottia gigantea TaxID=225164 RepID=V4A5S4_LOTGI|nr:hypothetical protein LOTGIDRAFT_163071 [Lottia gigantea]ESO92067.1 hypothetical protein LOTGIDRAFT_163071 [Lottia gigantea]